MSLADTNLDAITEAAVRALVEQGYAESKVIEYKRDLPGPSEGEKKEFLADISSMANTAGGHVVFGVRAEDGIPKEITPLTVASPEPEELRLQNILQDGLQPRVPGVQLRFIPLATGGFVLLIRVPRSWVAPHQVTYQKVFRFFGRHSKGKYPLDVVELRSLFLKAGGEVDRVQRFRTDRLNRILSQETPVPTVVGPKLVIHLLPLGGSLSVDVSELHRNPLRLHKLIEPSASSDTSVNLEGIAMYGPATLPAQRYVQVFRDASLEWVDTVVLSNIDRSPSGVFPAEFEHGLLGAIQSCLEFMQSLGRQPPAVALIAAVGVKGYGMELRRDRFPPRNRNRIDVDTVLLPEVVIESLPTDLPQAFRFPLEVLWNAAGHPRCPRYGVDGKWLGAAI